ncbi:MAG: EAL domain-containing protein [Rhodocyclaceae bacterium]|nr:MAG: EAL domain-containing protein [Rhodocyclaceae bacterium]
MTDTRLRNYWRLNLLSTGSALLIALVLMLVYHWYRGREDLQANLTMQARLLGANATAAIVFDDSRAAAEIVSTVDVAPIILEVALYRLDGSLMARFQRAEAEARFPDRAPSPGHEFSSSDLSLVVPVQLAEKVVGSIALRASLEGLYDELGRISVSLLLIVAVSAALGIYVSRKMRLRMAATENEIERMALYDQVTGLANRHAFELGLSQTLQRHARDGGGSSLLFIDVDDFKKVNDLFGHQIGDAVLRAAGERLGKALRAADIVARIGGDEFAAILTNTVARDDAAHVAENLVRLGAEPFETGSLAAHVGFSIGICMIPRDGANLEDALRNADLAMYQAKKIGKNTYQFFSENIGTKVRRGLDIEAGLRLAMKNDELYVVYQPQRSVRSGRIEGIEALVRWRHPERGMISPLEFIPVAEAAGLIQNVGRIVLDHVCRDIVELRGSGHVVPPVAVNVSVRQIAQGQVGDDIRAALQKYRLKPEVLKIEVTESVFLDHLDAHARTLDELQAAGIEIAIDDFGTGYSSLAYLRHLPVSILKIDMRFIRDLPDDAEVLALVNGIIAMGHAIGLSVIAEGVESAVQAECLREAGCDLLQGYHIGLPVRKQEMMLLLELS